MADGLQIIAIDLGGARLPTQLPRKAKIVWAAVALHLNLPIGPTQIEEEAVVAPPAQPSQRSRPKWKSSTTIACWKPSSGRQASHGPGSGQPWPLQQTTAAAASASSSEKPEDYNLDVWTRTAARRDMLAKERGAEGERGRNGQGKQ